MKTKPKIIDSVKPELLNQLEAVSNYTYLTYTDGSRQLSSYSLKVFAEIFTPKDFIRINRSLLVNRSFVKKYIKAGGKEYLQLKNDQTFIIPRRKTESLKLDFPSIFNN
ncbi:LytTr DNA-binding domain-containing protein [Spirosomataceae bacterium TFI 002]|nr:LytTr DNA-binding domain-containing protein [Spirosomataceae bacterium TFI 002]